MSVDQPNDCLTFRSNTVSGHLWAALILLGGVALLWSSTRQLEVCLVVTGVLCGLLLAVVGAGGLFSRPNVFCFDHTTGQLTIAGGTLLSHTEKRYPLSDIKAVKLFIRIQGGLACKTVKLVMLPSDIQDGKERDQDVIWGFNSESDWQAKADALASFLGVELKVERVKYED